MLFESQSHYSHLLLFLKDQLRRELHQQHFHTGWICFQSNAHWPIGSIKGRASETDDRLLAKTIDGCITKFLEDFKGSLFSRISRSSFLEMLIGLSIDFAENRRRFNEKVTQSSNGVRSEKLVFLGQTSQHLWRSTNLNQKTRSLRFTSNDVTSNGVWAKISFVVIVSWLNFSAHLAQSFSASKRSEKRIEQLNTFKRTLPLQFPNISSGKISCFEESERTKASGSRMRHEQRNNSAYVLRDPLDCLVRSMSNDDEQVEMFWERESMMYTCSNSETYRLYRCMRDRAIPGLRHWLRLVSDSDENSFRIRPDPDRATWSWSFAERINKSISWSRTSVLDRNRRPRSPQSFNS